MGGERDPLLQRRQRALMGDDVALVEFDFQFVPRLANLRATHDPGDRHRVTNGVHRDVAFHVHRALVQTVRLGNPRRQRLQVQPFDRE